MTPYFSDTLNILTNVKEVKEFPYPFAAIGDCLPDHIYKRLVETRPDWRLIAGKHADDNNKRHDLSAVRALDVNWVNPLWKQFIEYHTSRPFYIQILRKFGTYFEQFYPHLNFNKFTTALRGSGDNADIYMDCQISINTPVKEKSAVSGPHLDNATELWAALLYMKEPEDKAGGNLVIHKCTDIPRFYGKRKCREEQIRTYGILPYEANNMGCFMNSPFSIHSVTEREVTQSPRLFVNISLEFLKDDKALFQIGNT